MLLINQKVNLKGSSNMQTEKNLIFPTLITRGNLIADQAEKNNWFSAYLEYSNSEGQSMDFLGFNLVHRDVRFFKAFSYIADVLRDHLLSLSVDLNKISIYMTKAWFNVSTFNYQHLHDHADAHFSMTYYPHIAEGLDQKELIFNDINESRNSPYKGFLENIVTEDTDINGCEHIFNPKEGDIFVFPAYLSHEVGNPDDDIPNHTLDNLEWSAQKFKTYEQLQHSRFCVGCDAIITRRDTESYENLLLPVDMWKQY